MSDDFALESRFTLEDRTSSGNPDDEEPPHA